MRARAAAALLLAIAIPACAGTTYTPRSWLTGWHAANVGGTRVIGDLAEEEMRSLAGDLARFDAIYAKLAGRPEGGTAVPLTIYLLRNHEIGRRFGLSGGVAGWAINALDSSYIAMELSSDLDAGRSTLFHEFTHVLLSRNQRAPLPRWVNEGLATYFMTVNERSGAVVVGAAPGTFAARVAERGALPLDQIFDASTIDMSGTEVYDFYATSWALSHFLMSSASGRRELAAFLQQLARGVPSAQAQPAAFGRSLDQLGAELAAHVSQLARGVAIETLIDANAFAAPAPPSVVALGPGEVAYALGTLTLAMLEVSDGADAGSLPGLARQFLATAQAENAPAAPLVEAALGEARARSGDEDGALAAAQAALARAPDDANVRLRAARVALLRAEAEGASGSAPALAEAEAQFVKASALAPESASAWFGLGQVYARMGRPDDAFRAFESARRFGWSGPLDVALARIHLARGERAQAAELLRPIAQDAHESATQKEAVELLKQAQP